MKYFRLIYGVLNVTTMGEYIRDLRIFVVLVHNNVLHNKSVWCVNFFDMFSILKINSEIWNVVNATCRSELNCVPFIIYTDNVITKSCAITQSFSWVYVPIYYTVCRSIFIFFFLLNFSLQHILHQRDFDDSLKVFNDFLLNKKMKVKCWWDFTEFVWWL